MPTVEASLLDHVKPRKNCVICEAIDSRPHTRLIIDPRVRQYKNALLMRALAIADDVREEVAVGDVLIVHPEHYGADLTLTDSDTDEVATYRIIDMDYVHAVFKE